MFLNARYYFWILLILCISALLMPLVLRNRLSDGLLIGPDSYKSLRLGNEFREKNSISYDKLSYGGRKLVEEKLWYILLSIKPEFMARFLPIFFGILSFIIFYFLVSKIRPDIKGIASLLLVVSPPFLYLFSTATKYTGAIFFILLGFYLYLNKKKYLGFACFFISGLFSIVSLLAVVFVLLFYCLKREKSKDFYTVFFGFMILFLLQFYSALRLGLPENIFGFAKFSFAEFFSFLFFGLGGKYGFGFFMFFLAFIGIYIYYKEKYKFLFFYLILFLWVFASFYMKFLFSYLYFILVFFASIGLVYFLDLNWKSNLFRFLTLVIIFCGLIFSFLVFYSQVGNFEPSKSYFEGINFLKEQTQDNIIFTDYRNGDYITYAGESTVIDNNFLYAPEAGERWNDMNNLIGSKNLEPTMDLLSKYKINYILIDKRMKRDFFNNTENNLLFLLRYTPNIFINSFSNNEVEIWHNIDNSHTQV